MDTVTNIQEFKAAKTAARSIVSRRRASLTGGALLDALSNCETVDLLAALRFDLSNEEVSALESFTAHLNQRIEDRTANEKQRGKRINDQPAS